MLLEAGQVPRHLLAGEHATPEAPTTPATSAASPTRRHAEPVVMGGNLFGLRRGADPAAFGDGAVESKLR